MVLGVDVRRIWPVDSTCVQVTQPSCEIQIGAFERWWKVSDYWHGYMTSVVH